jgi:hypothetical protein
LRAIAAEEKALISDTLSGRFVGAMVVTIQPQSAPPKNRRCSMRLLCEAALKWSGAVRWNDPCGAEHQAQVESGGQALGLASIGIGLTELAAPQFVEGLLGLDDQQRHRGMLQVLGVRELMHGIGILTAKNGDGQTSSVSARVAGDVRDTALLGVAATTTRRPASFAAVAAAVAAIGVADLCCAWKASSHRYSRY